MYFQRSILCSHGPIWPPTTPFLHELGCPMPQRLSVTGNLTISFDDKELPKSDDEFLRPIPNIKVILIVSIIKKYLLVSDGCSGQPKVSMYQRVFLSNSPYDIGFGHLSLVQFLGGGHLIRCFSLGSWIQIHT